MVHKSASAASKSIAIASGKTAQHEALALDKAMKACRNPWWQGVRLAVLAGGVLTASGTGVGAATFTWTGSVPAGPPNPSPSFSVTDPANWGAPTATPVGSRGDIFTVSTPLNLTQILSGPFKVGSITVSNVTTLQREATAATATLDFDNGGTPVTIDVTANSSTFTVGTTVLPVAVHLTDNLSVNSTVGSVGTVTLNGVVDDLDNTNATANRSITVDGGVLNLNGANTYGGGTVINAGKVVVGNASGLGAATGVVTLGSAVAATPSAVLDLQAAGVNAYNVVVADGSTNAVINEKSSANTTTLGTLTFDITGGGTPATLQVNPNQATGVAATVNFGGVTLNGAADTISVGGTNGDATTVVFGADGPTNTGITGLGTLVKDGVGTLRLDGDSTATGFTGSLQINAGKLEANHADALGSSSVTIGNATLQLNKGFTTPGANAVTVSNGATATIVENSGTPTTLGVGANVLGVLTFEGGTPGTTNVPTTLNVNAGLNSSTSASVTFASVTLNGAADTINVGATASVVVSGAIGDIIGGGGALVKAGLGTLELKGASGPYTGGVSIDAGKLIAGNAAALGGSALPVVLIPTGDFSAGSNLITLSVADPSLKIGDVISGPGIRPGSQIVAINTAKTVLTLNTKTTLSSVLGGTPLSLIKPEAALASGATLELQALIGGLGDPKYNVSAGVGAGSTIVLNSAPSVPGAPEEYVLENVTAGKNAVITVNSGPNVDVAPVGPAANNQAVLVIGDNVTVPLAPTGGLSIDTSVTLDVQNGVNSGTTVRIDGEVKGDGGKLIKSGSGVLELTNNANSYSGGTVINAGTVRMGHNDPTATPTATPYVPVNVLGSGPVTIAGGALDVNRNTYDAGEVFTVGVGGRIFDGSREKDGGIKASREFNAPVTATAAVEVSLSGTAELVKSGVGELILAAKNTYTGGTVVNEGKLTLSGALAAAGLPTTAAADTLAANHLIRVQGGTLDLGGSTQHLGSAEFKLGGSSSNATLANGTIEKTSGNFTADVNPGQTATVEATAHLNSGAGGSVGLVKDGRGTLVLAGVNEYNSTTRINDGSVQAGAAGSLGSGSVELHGGNLSAASGVTTTLANSIIVSGNASIGNATGTQLNLTGGIAIDGGDQLAFNGAVQVGGVISEVGPGVASVLVDAIGKTVTLNAANAYTGATNVTGGVLVAGVAGAIGTISAVTVNGPSAELSIGATSQTVSGLSVQNAGKVTGSGQITSASAVDLRDGTVNAKLAGTSGVNKTGTGTATLGAANTYTGATSVTGGVLAAGAAGAIGTNSAVTVNGASAELSIGATNQTVSGLSVLGGGKVTGSGQIASVSAVDLQDGTVNAKLGGTAGVNKTGTGTVTLGSANAYTGATSVTGGVLVTGVAGAIGTTSAVNVNGASAELSIGATNQTVSGLSVQGGGKVTGSGQITSASAVDLQDGTVNAKLGGTAGVSKTGTGTATLGSANAYTGATSVTGGVLVAGVAGAIGTTSAVTVDGASAELSIGATNQTVSGLSVLGGGKVTGSGRITTASAVDLRQGTVDVTLVGTTGVNKTGTGTVTLTNASNSYGATNVNGGVLVAGVAGALGDGAITLNDGELSLGADQRTSGAITLRKGTVSGTGRTLATGAGITVNTVLATDSVNVSANLAGSLTKTGVGALNLSGNNASLNGLSIEAGAVSVTSNAALGTGNVNVDAGASLNGGVLNLDQAAPTLTVNGTLNANSLTVGAGKILKGGGVVNAGVVLAAGAQISPGNSPGILTVGSLSGTGDYIWERTAPSAGVSSPASVGTAGAAYDQINVTGANGSSQLNGITVRPRNLAGAEIPVTNTTAGGESFARDQVRVNPAESLVYASIIKGRFTDLPRFGGSDTAVIKIRLVQNDNPASGIDLVVDRKSYSQFAQNKNSAAFGSYLDSQLTGKYEDAGKVGSLLRELDAYGSNSDVTARLRAVDPTSSYASMFAVNVRRALVMSSAIDDHLDVISAEGAMGSSLNLGAVPAVGMQTPYGNSDKAFTAWTAGYAASSTQDATAGYGALHSTDNGGMLGLEGRLGNLTVGLVASTGQGTANFEDPSMKVDSENWMVGGYGSVAIGPVTVDATALFGTSDDKSSRATAKASYGSKSTQLGMGVSVNLLAPGSGWQVTPVARLKYMDYSQDAFEESGSGLLFNAGKLSDTSLLSKLGMRVSHRSQVSKDVSIGLDGAAYWVHDFDSAGKGLNTQLVGATGSFQSIGRKTNVESAQVNLGVHATFSETVTIRLSGQQDVGSASSQSSGVFSIALNF